VTALKLTPPFFYALIEMACRELLALSIQ